MKYRLTAFLLFILLMTCVFTGCKNSDTDNTTNTIPAGAVTDITYVGSSVATPDENAAYVKNIDGFEPDLTSNGDVACIAITDTPIIVSAMGSYTGKYVEDGSDEIVENICAAVIKNTGDKPIQYATVTLTDEDGSTYSFVISTLPAGCNVLVLETEKKAYTENLPKCTASADVTQCEELNIQSDKVKVTFDGELMHLENLTDTDFRAVYVRYKNYTAGNVYLGGITYNASFDAVTAGGTCEYDSAHFYTGGSHILMIEIIE